MYLKHIKNGDLVEVLELDALFDPNVTTIKGRYHAGEDMPEPAEFAKVELVFPSDESLPRCWVDVNYKAGA
jgi:hypothetical protein